MPEHLPSFYAITAPLRDDGSALPILEQPACRAWLQRFADLLAGGIELVQLRTKALGPGPLEELARHCQSLAEARGARLLLNGPATLARNLGMAGVHLTSAALMALESRPLKKSFLVGASCHSPHELAKAESIGADFACLSPIRATRGYTEADLLGFEGLADWSSSCSIPVYALGGMRREDLDRVLESGGQGISGISAFWPPIAS